MASLYKVSLTLALVSLVAASLNLKQVAALEPLVDTGISRVSPEGRHVAVHVPGFFNMELDTRGVGKGLRMSQTVMSGLVNIFIDRERQNGKLTGPIRVKVGGITMYSNGEQELTSDSQLSDNYNSADNYGEQQPLNEGSQLTNRLSSIFNRQNQQPTQ